MRAIRRIAPLLLIGVLAIAAPVAAQGSPFLSAIFNEHGWHYDLSTRVPNADGDGSLISLSANVDVAPGEVPDSVDFMLFTNGCLVEGAPAPIHIRSRDAWVTADGDWRSDDGTAVTFSLPLSALEPLTNATALEFECGSYQLALDQNSVSRFQRFYRAAVDPDELAELAVGPDASASDLRQPLTTDQAILELVAYRIEYDRFRDRYSVIGRDLPTEVFRGADSVRIRSLHSVAGADEPELTFFAFAVYGGDVPDGEARMRVDFGVGRDTVVALEQGERRSMPGGVLVAYPMKTDVAILAPIGSPTEFQLGEIEVALPVGTRRVLGQGFEIARSPESVERWARDVIGCRDLVEMSRAGETCQMTPERFEDLLRERSGGE